MKITKKDIKRVETKLKKAKATGDAKRVSFLQATLNIYKKEVEK